MFDNNPTILKMANYPRWTVSTKSKEPLSLKGITPTTPNPNFRRYHDDSDLVTLNEVNAIGVLKDSNRAYRMNSLVSNIIMIDIETHVLPEVKSYLMTLPYGYGETSMSGGTHLLVELPNNITFNPKYLPILTHNYAKSKDWGFEVITSNHFITFTKNEIPKNNNPSASTLTKLLDLLASEIKESENKIAIANPNSGNSEVDFENVKYLASLIPEDIKLEINQLDPKNFNNDLSRVDWQASMKIASYIKFLRDRSAYAPLIRDSTSAEIIETINQIISKRLTHRDKHDTSRKGLPYLKYTSMDAWEYVINH